jgi:hypothetical protein
VNRPQFRGNNFSRPIAHRNQASAVDNVFSEFKVVIAQISGKLQRFG